MARSKHRTTGKGTHRQRLFKARQALALFRKAETVSYQEACPTDPMNIQVEGGYTIGVDPAEEDITVVSLSPADPPVEDDELGHSLQFHGHENESLQDTLREFNGMLKNDKHEQLMETFVAEPTDAKN